MSNAPTPHGSRGRMQPLINQLIQLQDLLFARDQAEAASAKAHL